MNAHHLCRPPELPVQGHSARTTCMMGRARTPDDELLGRRWSGSSWQISCGRRTGTGHAACRNGRPTCPADSASGWLWPGPCCTTARSTSLTRPPPTSTWRARTTSWREITRAGEEQDGHSHLPPPGQRRAGRTASTCMDSGNVARERHARGAAGAGRACTPGSGAAQQTLENYAKGGGDGMKKTQRTSP